MLKTPHCSPAEKAAADETARSPWEPPLEAFLDKPTAMPKAFVDSFVEELRSAGREERELE